MMIDLSRHGPLNLHYRTFERSEADSEQTSRSRIDIDEARAN